MDKLRRGVDGQSSKLGDSGTIPNVVELARFRSRCSAELVASGCLQSGYNKRYGDVLAGPPVRP
jgi:hypothetical protein